MNDEPKGEDIAMSSKLSDLTVGQFVQLMAWMVTKVQAGPKVEGTAKPIVVKPSKPKIELLK